MFFWLQLDLVLYGPYLINNQKLILERAFFKEFLVSAELRTN